MFAISFVEITQGTILIAAAVLALGSTLQSAAGFGFGLLTIPVLILLGFEAYEAIVLCAVGASAQAVAGLTLLRRHVRWSRAAIMVALAALAMPAGVAVLGMLADQDRALVRRVFGGIVLLALLVQILLRITPRDRLPGATMVAAMLASGFMGGLSGMGGPPAVLWVMAHRWSNPESRTTLWALFGGTTPIQLLLLGREFGPGVGETTLVALALIPASFVGMLPGLWIGHRIPKSRLRIMSVVILAAIGVYAVVR